MNFDISKERMLEGMHTMNNDLVRLVREMQITKEDAMRVSTVPSELEKMLY